MSRLKPRRLLFFLFLLASLMLLSSCNGVPGPVSETTAPSPALPSLEEPTPADLSSAPGTADSSFVPDVEIDLKAVQSLVQVLPGNPTTVWTYQGSLVKGDSSTLQSLQHTSLGPVIRLQRGQKVRIRFINELPEASIIHWHGLLLPAREDGHPRDAVLPGETYVYEFEVVNRAGTYWFHPHPDLLTAKQVNNGLAGLLIISDEEEQAAGLPAGSYDIPLVIQDRTLDANNQWVYVQGDTMPGMASMEMMMGFLGDQILVNGQVNPLLPVATRAYRFRILNGSNSRVYKLAWGNGAPVIVLATDGGLLEQPVQRPFVMLAPGERIEVWADFRLLPLGSEVTLQSLPFLGAEGDSLLEGAAGIPMPGSAAPTAPAMSMGGMDHGSMPGMGQAAMPAAGQTPAPAGGDPAREMEDYSPMLPNGSAFNVLQIRVERQEQETLVFPTKLSTIVRDTLDQAVNRDQPRRFGLSTRSSTWLINGRAFELEEVAPDEVVKLNTLEVWEFVNELNPDEPMEKMGMVHPIHIHGVQFQVLDRQLMVPELQAGWDSVREGFVDGGWKDTVLIMPGERVRVLVRFGFPDLFLFHCHNLEHEDLGMMRNYRADP